MLHIMVLKIHSVLVLKKAESIGYRFRELNEWLYQLIDSRIKDI